MQKLPLHMMQRELLDEARKAFRQSEISPGMDKDKIMFEAGAKKVLDWMEKRLLASTNTTTVIAPKEEAEIPDSHEGFLRRALRGDTV